MGGLWPNPYPPRALSEKEAGSFLPCCDSLRVLDQKQKVLSPDHGNNKITKNIRIIAALTIPIIVTVIKIVVVR